ncbi:MAG: TOMM precursor leader peptide-binding protein, partial [Rhodoglobus sp.]
SLHALWLRRDVPHLPVVLSDTSAMIGPLVEPGSGPCLLCLELHRRDADDAWPAIATQLLGRRRQVKSAMLAGEAAIAAARMAIAQLGGPAAVGAAHSLRIDAATGVRRRREWQEHPLCGCRGIPSEESTAWSTLNSHPQENDSANAARLSPAAGS